MLTHRESFFKKHGLDLDNSYSLPELSRISGVPLAALKESFQRGLGAAKSNLASVRLKSDFSKNPDVRRFPKSARLSPSQWAYARVFSLLDKGKTYYTADADIAKKYGF